MPNGSLDSSSNTKSKSKKKPKPLRGESGQSDSSTSVLVSPAAPTVTSARLRLPRSGFLSMISPRSSNYERLEGGHGPSRTGGGIAKRFAWKKVAIGAVILIGLVFFFGPRESRSSWSTVSTGGTKQSRPMDVPDIQEDIPHPVDHPQPQTQKPPTDSSPPAKSNHPTTFESDPHPHLTTHCTSPHSADAPLVQWALMIDAGSTGSRIHVYKFNNCNKSPSFEYEVFVQIHPGLSSFAGNAAGAARSLDPLLEEALKTVPKDLQKCTPVAVKATAGLRLLPGKESEEILHAVEKRLRTKYPFQVTGREGDGTGVMIMDGKEEGVYAWITANYLLGTIGGPGEDKPTYAVLDLGGASTQIVFEPSFAPSTSKEASKHSTTHLEDGEHKYTLNFSGKTHTLYQHSYLGYGLMRARKSVHTLVEFMSRMRVRPEDEKPILDGDGWEIVANPCIAQGMFRTIEVPTSDVEHSPTKNITMSGFTIGSFDACGRIMQLVLAKDSVCEVKPCSFNGVYQPSLLDSFPEDRGKVLLLSYFYDRVWPLLYPEGVSPERARKLQPDLFDFDSSPPTPKLTISTFSSLAEKICTGPSAWKSHPAWSLSTSLIEELEGRPEWCLDLTFMYNLLRLGYEFGEHRTIRTEKQIEGTELGWCLGAAIGMVGEEGGRCRVVEDDDDD